MLTIEEHIALDALETSGDTDLRRFKEFPVAPEMLNTFLVSRTLRINSKLPDDVFVESFIMEADEFGRGVRLILTLSSKDFDPVPEGDDPPRIDPRDVIFTTLQMENNHV